MSTWHGLVGPAEYLLPDEEDTEFDLMLGVLTSASLYGVSVLANAYATYLDYRLVLHPATGNLVRREILRQGGKKASQVTFMRGLALIGMNHPMARLGFIATMVATSIPPSTRQSLAPTQPGAMHYFQTGHEYAQSLE